MLHTRMLRLLSIALAVSVISLVASVALATTTSLQIDATPAGGNLSTYSIDYSDGTCESDGNGGVCWYGEKDVSSNVHVYWDLNIDSDPGVSGPIQITNNFAVTATFNAYLSIPVSPALPAGLPMRGSSSISISDANFDGSATLGTPAGGALYHAQIDGVDERTLFNSPYSLSVAANAYTNSDTATFTGEFTDRPVTSDIDIRNQLTVTPGDVATLNSTFFITVPEPSTLVLALLGALSVAAYTRRR